MLLRYLYLLRSSWPRTLELLYWPTLQMLIWGFMSQFLYVNSSYVFRAFGVLLAAVMLWDVLFRGQLGLSISFLEEMWARNLGHLFVTPLRPYEWVAVAAGDERDPGADRHRAGGAAGDPALSLFDLFAGAAAGRVLCRAAGMGWALGLAICGMILRHGMGAESLAWLAVFTLSPVSAVYYPVSILPGWLQHVAWALPSTYVFEGMRAVLFKHVFRAEYLLTAAALDVVWLALGAPSFFAGLPRRPPPRRACCRWASKQPRRADQRYLVSPSTVKPCFSNAGRAAGDSRKARNFAASGFLLACGQRRPDR